MGCDSFLTILIPAYRAAATLNATLQSVFSPLERGEGTSNLEVIVVDDGSPDRAEIERICGDFPQVRLKVQQLNSGKLAAVNAGAAQSRGDVVMILDADDTLVADWPAVMRRVLAEWPASAPICYCACRNQAGEPTVAEPEYRGPLSSSDLLNERHAGEYLPLIRGAVMRSKGYIPVPGVAACEVVSYLSFAELGSFWVTPEVLRIYHEARPDSLSAGWGEPAKAEQMVRCYEALFAKFATQYAELAPRVWRTKRLRMAVYLMLAGRSGVWRMWWSAAALSVWKESLGSFLMCALGRNFAIRLVAWLKRMSWVRRYG